MAMNFKFPTYSDYFYPKNFRKHKVGNLHFVTYNKRDEEEPNWKLLGLDAVF